MPSSDLGAGGDRQTRDPDRLRCAKGGGLPESTRQARSVSRLACSAAGSNDASLARTLRRGGVSARDRGGDGRRAGEAETGAGGRSPGCSRGAATRDQPRPRRGAPGAGHVGRAGGGGEGAGGRGGAAQADVVQPVSLPPLPTPAQPRLRPGPGRRLRVAVAVAASLGLQLLAVLQLGRGGEHPHAREQKRARQLTHGQRVRARDRADTHRVGRRHDGRALRGGTPPHTARGKPGAARRPGGALTAARVPCGQQSNRGGGPFGGA